MRYLLALILAAALATPAFAGFKGPGAEGAPGGFQGPMGAVATDTVQKALQLRDDTRVMLTGNIIERVAGSNDEYIFKDATGSIQVEISPKVFRGQTVTPQTTVRITGKLDKDFGKAPEIEVRTLEVLQ